MSMEAACATLEAAGEACSDCGCCSERCAVLLGSNLTIGELARKVVKYLDGTGLQGLAKLNEDAPDMLSAVRRCCLCSRCTMECPGGINAHTVMVAVREAFLAANVLSTVGYESVLVDYEWNLFSVFRAVYGVSYADLAHLETIEPGEADVLFYPGCTLLSYAPRLTRRIYGWLVDQGFQVAISEKCCGSPLESVGLVERADNLKRSLQGQIDSAGITRVVTVCPGCHEALAKHWDGIELIPLPRLLDEAGVRVEASSCGRDRLAVFDSCHDRSQLFGGPIRSILSAVAPAELAHHGADTLCCGSGGLVSSIDPDLSAGRTRAVLEECVDAGSSALVTSCPTCSYAFAGLLRSSSAGLRTLGDVRPLNYLELVFGEPIDWEQVYADLEGMWSGEYAPWVYSVLT